MAIGTAALIVGGLAAAATAGSAVLSSRNERKAAESAADAQRDIATQQIEAAKGAEKQAEATANAQRKAAIARKSKTVLTTPLGGQVEDEQINAPSILGVPQ